MPAFDLSSGIASIAGLVFSILAWMQASRASKAATQARDAILIRTLIDELEITCSRMDQLRDFLEHERFAEAAMRAQEVVAALIEIHSRRSAFVPEDGENQLQNMREQMRIIEEQLYKNRRVPLPPESRDRMVKRCRDCSDTLRQNLGIMKRKVDSGERR